MGPSRISRYGEGFLAVVRRRLARDGAARDDG
jgi:hypothetical protein